MDMMPKLGAIICYLTGYDGVDLFAPTHLYGEPDDFRRFVERAHRLGLGVILDVVYNHIGPDGNFLKLFAEDYFTDRHKTPWGQAINLDGEGAANVRTFFIENALHWLYEYHLDGFRLDAAKHMDHFALQFMDAAVYRSNPRALLDVLEGMEAWLSDVNHKTVFDGASWVVMAAGTSSWTTLSLATGYDHDGNSNGTAQYRIVNLFGEPTIMMRGGITVSYSGGSAVNSGNILGTLLPAAARPVTLRTTAAPCSVTGSEIATVKLDAQVSGQLRLIIKSGSTPPWVSFNGVLYSL
jgi:hypothetical protein